MLKEILTKAVVSKGKINDINNEIIELDNKNISKVIGCWVINHNYLSLVENNKIYASGCYDIHIWYGVENNSDTFLYKKTIEYKQEFNMDNDDFDRESCEYKIYCLDYPNCSNMKLVDSNKIEVTINKRLSIDVIGESKLLVQVGDNNNNDIKDNININTNFINNN